MHFLICAIYYIAFPKNHFLCIKLQKVLIYICLVLLGTQCAQITPLTGGKKDTTPPRAISFKPENTSLNFNSKVIEIEFNEFISLKDVVGQFIITPQTKESPDIQTVGKKLKITFSDSLLPNTTYKLAFGNSITDLNESNVLQNFEYVFSTGISIDSLKLSGKVINAFDNKAAPQILVGLYNVNSEDSIIYKDKPLYISKTNAAGIFKFNYLPNSLYKIVAIKDENKNLLYDGSEEQIGFIKEYVNSNDTNAISLFLSKEIPTKSFIRKAFSAEYGKAFVIYNKPQLDIKEVIAKGLINFTQNKLKDTLTLYYDHKYDTLETYINYESKKIDTLYIKIASDNTNGRQKTAVKYTLQNNIRAIMPFFKLPAFETNVLFKSENLIDEKIILIERSDSIKRKPLIKILKNNGWTNKFEVQYDFKPEASYTLTIEKAAITDKAERINDSTSYQFKTSAIDDYAQLKLKLFFPRKENYIVMLLNDKEQIVDEREIDFSLNSTSEKIIEYVNLLPANYFIKVVEDANKNRLFDTGDYFLNKQPEKVFVNTTAIKLLAGWEIENEWIIQ
jgi:hypothetical protein